MTRFGLSLSRAPAESHPTTSWGWEALQRWHSIPITPLPALPKGSVLVTCGVLRFWLSQLRVWLCIVYMHMQLTCMLLITFSPLAVHLMEEKVYFCGANRVYSDVWQRKGLPCFCPLPLTYLPPQQAHSSLLQRSSVWNHDLHYCPWPKELQSLETKD